MSTGATLAIVGGIVLAGILGVCTIAGLAGSITRHPRPTASTPAAVAQPADTIPAWLKLDDPARFACEDFAEGWAAAQTGTARTQLADKVNKWSSKSTTPGIAEGGRGLGRTADGSDTAWQLAGDILAKACLDGGWQRK
jgi:hypothetical protein